MKSRAHLFALALVVVMMLEYAVYFSVLSIQRHRAFLTNASDLGQIDQAVWNSLQGRPLEFTRRTGEESIRLTDHVEPLFVLISPVFLLYHNVEALLILQSFVIAAGALAVFWIARSRLSAVLGASSKQTWILEFGSVVFAAIYLLFPSLEAANLAEFHAVTFVPAFVLFAYHYGSQKKWGRFALFALLLLLTKEEISLLVFMLAGYFAVADFRLSILDWRTLPNRFFAFLKTAPRIPLFFTILAVLWFVLAFFFIIPHFNAQGQSPYTCRYGVGEECPEVAHGRFLQQRIGYLLQLVASSGFISLLDPISLLLGAPLILANVISNYPAQYSGTFHYSAPVVPYFILAAVGGIARLIHWLNQRPLHRSNLQSPISSLQSLSLSLSPSLLLSLPLLLAFAYHLLAGYTPVAGAYTFPQISAHNALFQKFAAQIPPDAKLSTTPSLHPHLSHREFLYRYPVVNDADYVLLDVNESDRGIPSEFRIAYNNIVDDGTFGVVDAQDGYILLKRGAPKQNLPDAFYAPFRAPNAQPQYPVQIDFDNQVRLLGYDVITDSVGRGYIKTYWQRLKQLDQNYYLFPFVADEKGAPIEDLNFPMTLLFWYPSAAWHKDEIVVGKTLPLEWGDRARIGIGVTRAEDWGNFEARLPITRVEPSTLSVMDATWVDLGEFVRAGNRYQKDE